MYRMNHQTNLILMTCNHDELRIFMGFLGNSLYVFGKGLSTQSSITKELDWRIL